MQWSLIKIIFPLKGAPTLTSIYVPTTPSQTVLIAKRYCVPKKDLRTATDLKSFYCASLICIFRWRCLVRDLLILKIVKWLPGLDAFICFLAALFFDDFRVWKSKLEWNMESIKRLQKYKNVASLGHYTIYRSSRPEVFLRKGVLKICNTFTGVNRTSA